MMENCKNVIVFVLENDLKILICLKLRFGVNVVIFRCNIMFRRIKICLVEVKCFLSF